MKYLLMLLFISTPVFADIERTYDVYEQAISNYTYIYEESGQVAKDVTKPFTGDCRTFAVSMLNGVGSGIVLFVSSEEDTPHLIYASDGYAWECNGKAYKLAEYPYKVLLHLGAISMAVK